jgi:hypothetical protein
MKQLRDHGIFKVECRASSRHRVHWRNLLEVSTTVYQVPAGAGSNGHAHSHDLMSTSRLMLRKPACVTSSLPV